MTVKEKRKNIRIPFTVEASINYHDRVIEGEVLNISLQGMLIEINNEIPLNEELAVKMLLSGYKTGKSLELHGHVVRSDNSGTAIRLIKLNMESLIDLRNILLDHNADADKIMNEFYDFVNQRV